MGRHRYILVIALVAIIAVAGLSFGLVRAYAQGPEDLSATTPEQLLAKVAQSDWEHLTLSGDVTVKNELLGPLSALGGMSGGTSLQGGSGRLWIGDGKLRADVFGTGGADRSLYFRDNKLTIYDSAKNTLTEYVLPTGNKEATGERTPHTLPAGADLPAAIGQMLQKLAPTATVAVTGQETVAGRLCYLLTLTPASQQSLFGSIQVAVDGETFVPLRAQVFARGGAEPVFAAAFTKVSYDAVDDSVFTVPSPPGAKVEQKQLQLPWSDKDGADADAQGGPQEGLRHQGMERLTVAEAQAKAGFPLLALDAADTSHPFQGAYVIDLPDLSQLGGGSSAELPLSAAAALLQGPFVVLVYGQGFDTIALVETKVHGLGPALIEGVLGQVPFLGKTTVNGRTGFQLATPLLSGLVWTQGELALAAVGSVPAADLLGVASRVR